jgi:predicted ArsR family transcriptional regulator
MAQQTQPTLTPTEFSSAVTAITSAFGDPTRREIYLFVHERSDTRAGVEPGSGVTAAEVADRFALHPNVARHHLDKLAGGGYVEVATGRSSTGAGRPSKHYRVSTPEMTLELPVRHDDLLVTLLGKALSLLPDDTAEAMAEEVGLQYGQAMATSMGTVAAPPPASSQAAQRSFRAALHTVADALTAHGFAAHAERHGDGLRIVSDHCPFGGAAIEHPVICAVDRGLVRGMLGALYGHADAATSESRPKGDKQCVTDIRSSSQAELARRA